MVKHEYVLADIGLLVDANAFIPDHKKKFIHVVYADIKCECPYEDAKVALVVSNSLHVPSMKKKSGPPFMTREDVIQVNNNPKIRVNNTREE